MKRIKALITAVILCLAAFVPFTLTAEAEELVSGFCAVGEVKDIRAAILFADGTVRDVVSGFSETVRELTTPYSSCSSRGVFVSFPHVDVYKKTDIIMKNGRKFSVSRNCRTEFESRWINYLKKK